MRLQNGAFKNCKNWTSECKIEEVLYIRAYPPINI